MKPSDFNLILGILAGIILVIPFTGKVHDGRFRWFKGFTFRGWLIIIIFILSILISYFKDQYAEEDELEKIKAAKKEKQISDSISRKLNDESTSNTIRTIVSALAKYNLKYDSSQKQIVKLVRDSAKKSQTIYKTEDPSLSIYKIEFVKSDKDVNTLNVVLLSNKAASENINIKLYVASLEGEKYNFFTQNSSFYGKNGALANGETFSATIHLSGANNNTKTYYFWLQGTYENTDGKVFKINRIYSFEIESKRFGSPFEPHYSAIKDFFDKNIR